MRQVPLPFKELFKTNSLRNLHTPKQAPMPHKDNTYYLWVENYTGKDSEVVDTLVQGNKWTVSNGSINSYITLSDKASELVSNYLIQYGPQSRSSSFTIRVILQNDAETIRITASGWGSSVIELYDGDSSIFLEYLKEYQKRGL